jgi:hypothetical protein
VHEDAVRFLSQPVEAQPGSPTPGPDSAGYERTRRLFTGERLRRAGQLRRPCPAPLELKTTAAPPCSRHSTRRMAGLWSRRMPGQPQQGGRKPHQAAGLVLLQLHRCRGSHHGDLVADSVALVCELLGGVSGCQKCGFRRRSIPLRGPLVRPARIGRCYERPNPVDRSRIAAVSNPFDGDRASGDRGLLVGLRTSGVALFPCAGQVRSRGCFFGGLGLRSACGSGACSATSGQGKGGSENYRCDELLHGFIFAYTSDIPDLCLMS